MGNSSSSSEAAKRVYREFEPRCEWHGGKDHVTMDIELKDFKKQQLQVRTEKGSLVITGERALDPPNWERFRKEIKLQRDWNEEQIRAQLVGSGTLSIIIPKKETFALKLRNSFSTVTSTMKSVPKVGNFAVSVGDVVSVLNLLVILAVFVYIWLRNPNAYTWAGK